MRNMFKAYYLNDSEDMKLFSRDQGMLEHYNIRYCVAVGNNKTGVPDSLCIIAHKIKDEKQDLLMKGGFDINLGYDWKAQ